MNNYKIAYKIAYPLELPSNLPEVLKISCTCNSIEALAALNKQLRLYNVSDAVLTIDYKVTDDGTLLAKRYCDDALLTYTKNGECWELISRKFFGVAANIKALASYIEHLRKAKETKIITQKKIMKDES